MPAVFDENDRWPTGKPARQAAVEKRRVLVGQKHRGLYPAKEVAELLSARPIQAGMATEDMHIKPTCLGLRGKGTATIKANERGQFLRGEALGQPQGKPFRPTTFQTMKDLDKGHHKGAIRFGRRE